MRKAFSMLTAIIVIVLMAGVSTLVMNLSGKIIKETGAQYRKEQAILLAKSYTEFAILAIQGHNMSTNGCLEGVYGVVNNIIPGSNANADTDGTGYRVSIQLTYIGLPATISCDNKYRLDSAAPSASSDTSVLIDVNVRYKDPAKVSDILSRGGSVAGMQEINYNRRTLQRL